MYICMFCDSAADARPWFARECGASVQAGRSHRMSSPWALAAAMWPWGSVHDWAISGKILVQDIVREGSHDNRLFFAQG